MFRAWSTLMAILMSLGLALKLMPVPLQESAAIPPQLKFGLAKDSWTWVYCAGIFASLLSVKIWSSVLAVPSQLTAVNQLSLQEG